MNIHRHVIEAFSAIENAIDTRNLASQLLQLFDETVGKDTPDSPITQIHPLGFFAVTWPIDEFRALRLHFWSRAFEWRQSTDLQVHDHTFWFTSAVLLGQVGNYIYSTRKNSEGNTMYLTSYSRAESRLIPQADRVELVLQCSTNHPQGTVYQMPAGLLHKTVLESEVGLTALAATYKSSARDGARVVGSNDETTLSFARSVIDSDQMRHLLFLTRNALTKSIDQATGRTSDTLS